MKFLIIGASGFVGRHTYEYIKSLGYVVLGTESKLRKLELITFNLAEDRIKNCINPSFFLDGPVFCVIPAFIAQIDTCSREKEISYEINVKKMGLLLRDLKDLNVKIVFISSSFIFDGKEGHYDEKHSTNPICEYGRHKDAVEKYIQENIPEALVLRLDKVIGDNPQEKHLFSEWYNLAKENKPINCIAGQLFSPTYVEDIARAIVLSCQKNLLGVYNLANNEVFTRYELARNFLSFIDKKAEIVNKTQEELGFIDFRPLKTNLDSTKLVKAINIKFIPMQEVFNKFKEKL